MSDQYSFERGKQALLYFHNRALRYNGYDLSFEQFLNIVETRGYKNFTRGLGDGILEAEASNYQVRVGMEALADNGKGKIPSNNGAFTQAIANSVSENISYVSAALYVSKESAVQIGGAVVNTAQNIGDTVIQAGKSVNQAIKLVNFLVEYWYVTIPLGFAAYYSAQLYLVKQVRK